MSLLVDQVHLGLGDTPPPLLHVVKYFAIFWRKKNISCWVNDHKFLCHPYFDLYFNFICFCICICLFVCHNSRGDPLILLQLRPNVSRSRLSNHTPFPLKPTRHRGHVSYYIVDNIYCKVLLSFFWYGNMLLYCVTTNVEGGCWGFQL